jgi:hypothetical protein
MADTVEKNCMDMCRKLDKSRVFSIIEGLEVPNILEICHLYKVL